MQKEDRRKQKRRKEENRVEIEAFSGKNHTSTTKQSYAFTKDISLNGLRLQSDVSFSVDSLLRMKLTLSKSRKTLVMRGRVKWVRAHHKDFYEIGVEFEQAMPAEYITLIGHLYGASEENSH
ncbi:PilZ domain-containing protein [bacterium]|nr:PilZ domain-containing protein [bacterium]